MIATNNYEVALKPSAFLVLFITGDNEKEACMLAKPGVPWKVRRNRVILLTLLVILVGITCLCSFGGAGACVGSGGDILRSPVCNNDWTSAECREWDQEEINGANWDHFGGRTCERLGYTDRCSDGSYRLPGDC